MRMLLISWLSLSCSLGMAQSGGDVCQQLDDLVNERLPESFEGYAFEDSPIELEGNKEYKKTTYPFLGQDFIYFTDEGETNKRLLAYPTVTADKQEALERYIAIKESLDQCELVFATIRQNPNPNIGVIGHFTIGLNRRFYSGNLRLYQKENDAGGRYWIEVELIAPKQESE